MAVLSVQYRPLGKQLSSILLPLLLPCWGASSSTALLGISTVCRPSFSSGLAGPEAGPGELEVEVILGGVFSGGAQWGCGQLPWPSSVCTPGFLFAESRVRSRPRPAPPHPTPPLVPPDPTHGSPHTAQLPPFTDRAGACARRARRPANPRGLRHQPAPPTPPLNSGSRRRPAAAVAALVRVRAPLPRPPRPGPRRRAAWSGR